jgi:hypothetical protein
MSDPTFRSALPLVLLGLLNLGGLGALAARVYSTPHWQYRSEFFRDADLARAIESFDTDGWEVVAIRRATDGALADANAQIGMELLLRHRR